MPQASNRAPGSGTPSPHPTARASRHRLLVGGQDQPIMPLHANGFMGTRPSTTLADLLLRLFTASSSAVWASLRWRSKYEIDDGVAHRWQAWLRRRSVDSFFSAPLVRGDGVARRRRRSWSSARDDEDLAMIAPRSDQARVPLSTADAPIRKSIVP